MDSNSSSSSSIDWRGSKNLFFVAVGLYVVSLMMPAIGKWNSLGDSLWGFHVLVWGWGALDGPDSNYAWLANLLMPSTLAAWRFEMPKTAVILSFCGLILALTAFEVGSLIFGAYLWLSSFAILFVASIQFFRKNELLTAF